MNLESNEAAIFYITNKGFDLAQRLKGLYQNAHIFGFQSNRVREIWNKSKTLIFIMSAGIVVRTIAPLVKDKRTDPAVVVLDEKGRFAISLLSGHIGGANHIANGIADFLGGEAVITTASDIHDLTSIDLWALENDLVIDDWKRFPKIATRLLGGGALRVFSEMDLKLPDEFLKVAEQECADLIITNKHRITMCGCHEKEQLYLRPKNLIVGLGCNKGTSLEEIEGVIKNVVKENNLSFLSIKSISTIDKKRNEPGLMAFAEKHGFEIKTFSSEELNKVRGISKSEAALKAVGAIGVSEPAALLASGTGRLLVKKQKVGNVTVAMAERKDSGYGEDEEKIDRGKIYMVGTGPGSIHHITPYAQDALRKSDIIIGYSKYLDLIRELIKDKEVFSTEMTQEIDRCKKAVELAMSGKNVSVISGGDPGIYGMAGLVFEILKSEVRKQKSEISAEVIPGISALNACAARLGAPLMHDFACISLSDRLTPWEIIKKRIEAASIADFVIVIYNPKSKGRVEHINKARDIILQHRKPETPVGIVKGAMRKNEDVVMTDLGNMPDHDMDMQTTVVIGNSQTFVWNNQMITPRGYENKFKF